MGIPDDIRSAKLKKGESHFSWANSMLFTKWRDQWDMLMLSTFHDDTFIKKRCRTQLAEERVEVILKPQVVEDYNLNKGGCGQRSVL